MIVGADGANFEHVARVLTAMLYDLGLLRRDKLEICRRHDLIKSSTAATLSATQTYMHALTDRGGLLLVRDAGGLATGDRDHARNCEYAKVALEAVVGAATAADAAVGGYAVALTTKGSCHATLLRACPALAAASPLTSKPGSNKYVQTYQYARDKGHSMVRKKKNYPKVTPKMTPKK